MARSRIIKPEFFQNEDLIELPALTRLLYIGLWCNADRDGRLEDRPKRLKLTLFPGDDCNVDSMLNALAKKGLVIRYEIGGQRYIAIPTFGKHQSPHISEKSKSIPPPPKGVEVADKHQTSTVQAPDKYGASTEQAGIFPPHSDSDSDSDSLSFSDQIPDQGLQGDSRAQEEAPDSDQKESGPKTSQGTIRLTADCEPLAENLFRKTGYTGEDGGLLWRVAALVTAGALTEYQATDAAEGCRIKSPSNPLGYFRRTLEGALDPGGKAKLKAMLARVVVPRGMDLGAPKSRRKQTASPAQVLAKAMTEKAEEAKGAK